MRNKFNLGIEITQITNIKNKIVSKIRWVVERSFDKALIKIDCFVKIMRSYERLFL